MTAAEVLKTPRLIRRAHVRAYERQDPLKVTHKGLHAQRCASNPLIQDGGS
jgi:hypothetical protein